MTRASLFLPALIGLAGCTPLDVDFLIELDPPEWTEAIGGAACPARDTHTGDVKASAIDEAALKGACAIVGNVTIDADLETSRTALAGVREIQGNLTVMKGFSGGVLVSLERVTGRLDLRGGTSRVDGPSAGTLGKLRRVGGLTASGLPLEALDGLSGLEEVEHNLTVGRLAGATFTVLQKLRRVGEELRLSEIDAFTDVGQLPALAHVGSMVLEKLPGLTSVGGPSVIGSLTVSGCDGVEQVGLEGVTRLVELRLTGNGALESISMPDLEVIESTFQLRKNPKLRTLDMPSLMQVPSINEEFCGNSPELQADLDVLNARFGEERLVGDQGGRCL